MFEITYICAHTSVDTFWELKVSSMFILYAFLLINSETMFLFGKDEKESFISNYYCII